MFCLQLWLTGDFLHNFTKIKNQSQMLSSPPTLKLIYPSLGKIIVFIGIDMDMYRVIVMLNIVLCLQKTSNNLTTIC